MAAHDFTLLIRGVTADHLDAVFAAEGDDATFFVKDEFTVGEFALEAPTLPEAVLSAIVEVESVEGAEVVHVDSDELVGVSEIAERTGRSDHSIDRLLEGQRGPGEFPAPVAHLSGARLWQWPEVAAWFAAYQGRQADSERWRVIGVLNGALQVRHGLRTSPKAVPLRSVVRHLLAHGRRPAGT